MTQDQIIIFAILAIILIAFILDRWRFDLVALFGLGLSLAAGVVPFDQAFSGFSDPVVITVACILIISAALNRSGFVDYILRKMGYFLDKPYSQVFALCLLTMTLSAFMNNIGALAIIMPVALSLAAKSGRNPSEILMPLSFSSLLGGLVTLIGTPPNLLISDIRAKYAGEAYDMFDFAPVGLILCLCSLAYVSLGWRFMPKDRKGSVPPERKFKIHDYISEVKVVEKSLIADKKIYEIESNFDGDLAIVGLVRDGKPILAPGRNKIVREEDIMIVRGDPVEIKRFVDQGRLILTGNEDKNAIPLSSDEVGVIEAVIMTGSELTGLTVKSLRLRQRFGLNLLAVRSRGGKTLQLKNMRLQEGDVIALQGDVGVILETLQELNCLPLAERNLMLGRRYYALLPALIMLTAVLSTITIGVPVSIAFGGAVLAIAILRVLRMDEIYEAINWPIIVLLGALLPVTEALQTTGGHELIATGLLPLAGSVPEWGVLAAVMIVSMAVTPFLNNAAAVLVMAPVAVSLAAKMDVSIDPFLMAVAVGTSCDFLTPIGHQSNTLVMGPGGYKFSDYFRFGMPLTLMVIAVGVPAIMFIWPLHP